MVAWIILGTLIFLVIVYLVVTGFLDKKRSKKVKIEKENLEKLKESSRQLIALWVILVAEHNQKILKQFVPAVGKIKMSEIRLAAKKALDLLTQRQEYQLMSDSEKNQDMIKHFNLLKTTNSNNWKKAKQTSLDFFHKNMDLPLNQIQNLPFYHQAQKEIEGVYYELTK